jgi:ATP phosphoribosyltransferase regulatory subunit
MIVPIPSGTRDVLPDEMRELHAIVEAVRGVFADAGYGEIATPALEYESVLGRGATGGVRPATASSTRAARSWCCAPT